MAKPPKAPPKSPAPAGGSFKQIPVLAFSEWSSVNAVKQALNEMEWGMLRTAALLVEAMGRDDRITGVMETRLNALNGLPLEWKPADDSAKAQEVADECQKLFPKMIPEPERNLHRQWGIMLGLGIAELNWKDEGANMWLPTVRIWNPQFAWWRWDVWSYFLTTQDAGQVQLLSGQPGRHKWFLYAPYGEERGWVGGAVRSLAIPWLIRQWDWRDWARFSEIHGMPVRAGIVPAEAAEEHKERFIRELAALGQESTIRLEQSARADGPKFDLKLVEAMSTTSWQSFPQLMNMANTAIAVRLLGQNLTTEGGTQGASGNRALGEVHDRVRADFLRSDATTYARAFKEQVLEPFCKFNFGDEKLAPALSWKTDPPDDKKGQADTLLSLGQGINQLILAGIPVDVIQLAKKFSVPLASETPNEPIIPQQGPPGGDDEGDDKDEKDKGDKGGAPPFKPGDGPKPGKAQQSRRTRLKPHVEGQLFVDHVGDIGVDAAQKAIAPDLKRLLEIVQSAKSYQGLRTALLKEYGRMDPSKFARLMDKCLVLADHAGRHSVLEEL